MRNTVCRLPNGQSYTVTPVFGGVNFKSNDMHLKDSIIPPGWTIVLYTNQNTDQPAQDSAPPEEERGRPRHAPGEADDKSRTSRFTTPTLHDDCFYISFIVAPPSSDFKPPTSPTRQIAMMIWVSLYWYFHEPEPDLHLQTDAASNTPLTGKPKGEWRIHLKREGIFKGRNLLQKLERMGLIASEESSVGLEPSETRESGRLTPVFSSLPWSPRTHCIPLRNRLFSLPDLRRHRARARCQPRLRLPLRARTSHICLVRARLLLAATCQLTFPRRRLSTRSQTGCGIPSDLSRPIREKCSTSGSFPASGSTYPSACRLYPHLNRRQIRVMGIVSQLAALSNRLRTRRRT
jgi:hypothetical protein